MKLELNKNVRTMAGMNERKFGCALFARRSTASISTTTGREEDTACSHGMWCCALRIRDVKLKKAFPMLMFFFLQ